MTDLLDFMDTTPTDQLSLGEIRDRVLRYFRQGQLPSHLKGPVLGFAGAVTKGRATPKQIELMRGLVRECRYLDGTEPVDVIDDDDRPEVAEAEAEMDQNWRDFA